jgi:hypothetical protein
MTTIFYLRSDGAYCADEGQSWQQIISKCSPLIITFISEADYQSAILSLQEKDLPQTGA